MSLNLPHRRALLASTPAWVLPGATVNLDFANARCFPGAFTDHLSSTNSTGGYATDSAGNLILFPANTLRRTDKGLLIEQSSTNLALWARDMTQAGTWAATNVTAAKTATGADGTANAATTLTATANNGTILQTPGLASAQRTYSVYIKRRTGTGAISIAPDGATWTDVTASLNSSTYTRVSVTANVVPIIGIKIATSGDAIDVDFNQLEALASATSPIATTTVTAARSADVVQLINPALISNVRGTFFVEWQELPGPVGLRRGLVSGYVSNAANLISAEVSATNKATGASVVSAVTQANLLSTNSVVANTIYRAAYAYDTNDFAAAYSSALQSTVLTDTSGSTPSAFTNVVLGAVLASSNWSNNYIRRLAWSPARTPNASLLSWAQAP